MAFLSTFAGLLLALVAWVGLYTFAVDSRDPLLVSLASYLEAFSVGDGYFSRYSPSSSLC